MKKLLVSFVLAAILIPFSASAQNPQPQARGFVEGGIGFGGCSGDCEGVDSSIGINISGFYMIMPNIAVGATIRYQMYSVEFGDLSSMALGVEGRFYLPLNPMLKLYGLGSVGYTTMTYENDYGDGDDSAFFVQLGGGVEYSITPLMAIGAQLKYQINSWDESEGDFDEWYLGATVSFKF
ncbi:porin family protein [Myxococcota bacterium]|nr:porin family protein [Myxococcota bacterium]MBU1379597.1 porin family protein [Myxococcota bacterium]MBU1496294.1 porin family protein [Myxococcota bacterium]